MAASAQFEFSTDNGVTWSAIGTVNANSALLLRPVDKIRFLPASDNGTAAQLQVRAWDQHCPTDGLEGTKVDISSFGTGDTSPFSSAIEDVNLTVTAVNDEPTIALGATTIWGYQ